MAFIISDAAIEFKKELNYGDVVSISVAAAGFEKFGFDIFYKLEIADGDKMVLAGRAKTAVHCYDYTEKKLVPVPERVKERLGTTV